MIKKILYQWLHLLSVIKTLEFAAWAIDAIHCSAKSPFLVFPKLLHICRHSPERVPESEFQGGSPWEVLLTWVPRAAFECLIECEIKRMSEMKKSGNFETKWSIVASSALRLSWIGNKLTKEKQIYACVAWPWAVAGSKNNMCLDILQLRSLQTQALWSCPTMRLCSQ